MSKEEKESVQFSELKQSDVNAEDQGSRKEEVVKLWKEVEILHNLDRKEWAIDGHAEGRMYDVCTTSYYGVKDVTKVETRINAPFEKALSYVLYPPYGNRNAFEKCWERNEVTEYLKEGAAIVYMAKAESTWCLCTVRERDLVALSGLQIKTPNVAIFAMKSIEHPSHPVLENVYRVDMPLWGFYLEQHEDVAHLEVYSKPINMKGHVGRKGKVGLSSEGRRQLTQCSQTIPKLEDIGGEPPYLKFL